MGSPSYDKENDGGVHNRSTSAPSKSPLMGSHLPDTATERKSRRREEPAVSRDSPQPAEQAEPGLDFQDTAETSHPPNQPDMQTVLPEDVLRQKLQVGSIVPHHFVCGRQPYVKLTCSCLLYQDMIRVCRKQREDRTELAEQLFSDQAWVKDTRQASEALQKKEELIAQLNQLISALQVRLG